MATRAGPLNIESGCEYSYGLYEERVTTGGDDDFPYYIATNMIAHSFRLKPFPNYLFRLHGVQ